MSQNNIIPLFPDNEAQQGKSKKPKKSKATKTLVDLLKKVDLSTNHPATGLKYGGYMPLACISFTPELFGNLNPTQFKLFMYLTFLLWRYPVRPGCVRAALPYLSKGIGIARCTVHSALTSLEEFGLIECEEVNWKLGNIYRVLGVALWAAPVQMQDPGQQSENQTTTAGNSDGCSLENRPLPSENQTQDLSSSNLSLSLSKHLGFQSRWNDVSKNIVKKEREIIQSILRKYPDDLEDIYQTLEELETTGKDFNGNPCGSPIGLIYSSWAAIRKIRLNKISQNSNSTFVSSDETEQEKNFKRDSDLYLSSLSQRDLDELHRFIENEILRSRPNIGEIRRDSRIYESFLKEAVANRLGIELPENN